MFSGLKSLPVRELSSIMSRRSRPDFTWQDLIENTDISQSAKPTLRARLPATPPRAHRFLPPESFHRFLPAASFPAAYVPAAVFPLLLPVEESASRRGTTINRGAVG
jgi:hypothetical protein